MASEKQRSEPCFTRSGRELLNLYLVSTINSTCENISSFLEQSARYIHDICESSIHFKNLIKNPTNFTRRLETSTNLFHVLAGLDDAGRFFLGAGSIYASERTRIKQGVTAQENNISNGTWSGFFDAAKKVWKSEFSSNKEITPENSNNAYNLMLKLPFYLVTDAFRLTNGLAGNVPQAVELATTGIKQFGEYWKEFGNKKNEFMKNPVANLVLSREFGRGLLFFAGLTQVWGGVENIKSEKDALSIGVVTGSALVISGVCRSLNAAFKMLYYDVEVDKKKNNSCGKIK